MKIEVEIRTSMSRAETFKALRISADAAERLAHRMTDRELARLSEMGAALIGIANGEGARRARQGNMNRIAAGPPLLREITQ